MKKDKFRIYFNFFTLSTDQNKTIKHLNFLFTYKNRSIEDTYDTDSRSWVLSHLPEILETFFNLNKLSLSSRRDSEFQSQYMGQRLH